MKKYRGAWYEPYKIMTPLTPEEIEKRLGSKNGKFQISTRMWNLPSNWKLFFLPKIAGEIIEAEDGKGIVLIWLKVSIIDLMIALAIYACVCFFMRISVLVYASTLCLVAALVTICWQSARKRFGKRLKMLLKGF